MDWILQCQAKRCCSLSACYHMQMSVNSSHLLYVGWCQPTSTAQHSRVLVRAGKHSQNGWEEEEGNPQPHSSNLVLCCYFSTLLLEVLAEPDHLGGVHSSQQATHNVTSWYLNLLFAAKPMLL